MKNSEYFSIIEAILFASGEPISTDKISTALEISLKETDDLMSEFLNSYNKAEKGIQVVKLSDSYQLCTKKEYESYIKIVLELKKQTPLSQAGLETLAIVAYNQPVTKSFIEQVRGVDSSSIVNSLCEKGLLEEAGRLEVPGRPIAYKTTHNFLRSFNMESLEQLPPLPSETQEKDNKNE